jgi:hypothetical protein
MSKFLLQESRVVVGAKDLSNYAFNIDTPEAKPQIDVSGFNPAHSSEFLPGIADQTITVQFRSDFAANSVHATLYPLYAGGSVFVMYTTPTSGSVSATNPAFGGSAMLYDYNGLSGALGADAQMTVTFKPAPGAVWTWGTVAPT